MKKIFSITILGLVILSSCSKKSDELLQSNSTLITPKTMNFIGLEHNKGLDFIYQRLKNKSLKSQGEVGTLGTSSVKNLGIEKNDLIEFVQDATNLYVDDNYPQDPTTSLAHQLISSVCTEDFVSSSSSSLYNNQIVSGLTYNETQFLDALNVIVSDNDNSLASIISRIESLESTAYSFSDQEKYVVFSASVVAKNSLTYWHDNYSNWQNLFPPSMSNNSILSISNNKNNYQVLGDVSWKTVGKADIAGAVGGAVRSGVAAFFGPVGWGAFGASVIGTALGGSASAAVLQWIS